MSLDACAFARLVRELPKALRACERALSLLHELRGDGLVTNTSTDTHVSPSSDTLGVTQQVLGVKAGFETASDAHTLATLTYIHTCIYIYIHTCIHTYIHTYTYTHTHTHAHTHTHTHTHTHI